MSDENLQVSYTLNPKTHLTKDWKFPLKWKDWFVEDYGIKPELVNKAARRFKKYHIANNESSRNWFATWKIWAHHELVREKCLKEKKKYIPTSEKLCPSCHQKFKD